MWSPPGPVDDMMWLTWSGQIYSLLELNESDIQAIWRKPSEPELKTQQDYDDLEYGWNIPLYQKMIFRLRNCPFDGKGFYFWNQIDPCNRALLVNYFRMENCSQVDDVLNMLIWYFNMRPGANDRQFKREFDDPEDRATIFAEYQKCLDRE